MLHLCSNHHFWILLEAIWNSAWKKTQNIPEIFHIDVKSMHTSGILSERFVVFWQLSGSAIHPTTRSSSLPVNRITHTHLSVSPSSSSFPTNSHVGYSADAHLYQTGVLSLRKTYLAGRFSHAIVVFFLIPFHSTMPSQFAPTQALPAVTPPVFLSSLY